MLDGAGHSALAPLGSGTSAGSGVSAGSRASIGSGVSAGSGTSAGGGAQAGTSSPDGGATGDAERGRTRVFLLTDASAERVRTYAGVLADWAADGDGGVPLEDVAHTLARRAGRGRVGAAVVARDAGGLVAGLRAVQEEAPTGVAVTGGPGPVWVFSGYGSQWAGMGARLYAGEPVFAAAIDELDPLFREEAGIPLREIVAEGREAAGVAAAQPVIFAVQVALARLWTACGVRPAAVIGHSMGEVAAAVVAGGIGLADAVRVICRRARLLGTLGGGGAMAVLEVSAEEVPADLHVAVYASPRQCVVTGDPDRVAAFAAEVAARGLLSRLLTAEGAGHSPQVRPLLPKLREALDGIAGGKPEIPFYSTVFDEPREIPTFEPAYWAAGVRRPVRLLSALRAAAEDGHTVFTEISPHPVLAAPLRDTLPGARSSPTPCAGATTRSSPSSWPRSPSRCPPRPSRRTARSPTCRRPRGGTSATGRPRPGAPPCRRAPTRCSACTSRARPGTCGPRPSTTSRTPPGGWTPRAAPARPAGPAARRDGRAGAGGGGRGVRRGRADRRRPGRASAAARHGHRHPHPVRRGRDRREERRGSLDPVRHRDRRRGRGPGGRAPDPGGAGRAPERPRPGRSRRDPGRDRAPRRGRHAHRRADPAHPRRGGAGAARGQAGGAGVEGDAGRPGRRREPGPRSGWEPGRGQDHGPGRGQGRGSGRGRGTPGRRDIGRFRCRQCAGREWISSALGSWLADRGW
nr:hypothetical protein GCM10020093_065200 [Planobispora longispora]